MSGLHAARSHWREAADVYDHGLSRDMLAEPIYRALMRVQLQLQQGERAEAMRIFARCRDLLTTVLGVPPPHKTWALREQAAGSVAGHEPRARHSGSADVD